MQKRICYITTVSSTINAFILKAAIYIHENANWDITFICDKDDIFAKSLPDYIHYIPIPMKRGISLSSISSFVSMVKVLKRENFDLIQYSTPNASLYASIAGKLVGVPVRLYCQWGIAYVGFNGVKRQVFKFLEKMICANSTWIEPDSYSNLSFSHNEGLYNGNKSSVIWNGSACGVDLSKFDISKRDEFRNQIREELQIDSESVVFGFVGRVTRDKGINELLTSFKQLFDRNNNIYLLLVGANEVDKTVDEELYNWSLSCANVIYTGMVTNVENYLSAMDIYILPSYREGFGMSVIEAEAMGLPVIVTRIPGPVDAVIENATGLIVEKKNSSDLYEKMNYLLENNDEMIRLGLSSNEFVKNKFDSRTLFEFILEDRKRLLGEL